MLDIFGWEKELNMERHTHIQTHAHSNSDESMSTWLGFPIHFYVVMFRFSQVKFTWGLEEWEFRHCSICCFEISIRPPVASLLNAFRWPNLKNQKSSKNFDEKSTSWVQSHLCSFIRLEMTTKWNEDIQFRNGKKKFILLTLNVVFWLPSTLFNAAAKRIELKWRD